MTNANYILLGLLMLSTTLYICSHLSLHARLRALEIPAGIKAGRR